MRRLFSYPIAPPTLLHIETPAALAPEALLPADPVLVLVGLT